MDHLLRPIYQERIEKEKTLGVLQYDMKDNESNVTDTFDSILLIAVAKAKSPIVTKHYLMGEQKIATHIVTEKMLRKWLQNGSNRKVISWVLFGEVLFERNDYLQNLRLQMQTFPYDGRNIKTGIQFAKLIRRYLEGKEQYAQGNYLDAYIHVLSSVHHLGRLSVIDSGAYPEVSIWSQVKEIEPAIFKLYEELVLSDEPLQKRLELLFLASEFFIHSRTEDGAAHILEVMNTKEYWKIQELHEHEELEFYSKDLEVFIEYLIKHDYILVEPFISRRGDVMHRHYKVNTDKIN